MNIYQIAFYAIGSAAVAYSLWHIGAAIFSDDYDPPNVWKHSTAAMPTRLFDVLRAIAIFVGCLLIGSQLGHALLWWMPFDWGTDIEGEFQSYRERFSQLFACAFGLACLMVPERAYERCLSPSVRLEVSRWRARQTIRMSQPQAIEALCQLGLEVDQKQRQADTKA